MDTIWNTASAAILTLPGYLLDANKRIFWLYLLGALLMALTVYMRRAKNVRPKGLWHYLFNPRIWLAKSARQDYAMMVINKLIKALLLIPLIVLMVPIALGTTDLLEGLFGLHQPWLLSPAWVMFVFTLALFVFDDFTRFVLHYLLHKIPFLWEFHKVHHSAKVLTPFTIYRSHPLESYLYACRMALTQGIVVGMAYYLFGPSLSMYDIVGANVFVFIFNVAGSNLRHSHVWLSWGDKLEHWFISPAQHQIHHSDQKIHVDINMGTVLAVWDRLLNTHLKASAVGTIRFGLGPGFHQHDSLFGLYFRPFQLALGRLRPRFFWTPAAAKSASGGDKDVSGS